MRKKIIFTIFIFFIVVTCINISSFATFEITNFVIDSELSSDGNLHVAEKITYYTDEVVNGLTRKIITKNPENEINSASSLKLNSVKVDEEICNQVSSGVKGQDKVFEYTSNGNSEYNIKLYSPFDTTYKAVEYDYVLNNVAVKYNDIGELFWNFIGDEWDCKIQNLTINIILPEMAANETSYVFGHGSDNGTFTKNGNYITLNAKNIKAYQPLDARILFSKEAISNSPKNVNRSVLNEYINQEEGISSKNNTKNINGNSNVKSLAGKLSIIIICVGFAFYMFQDTSQIKKIEYYREIPLGLAPELLQYIYYGEQRSNSYYIAVLNLIKLGVYRLAKYVDSSGEKKQKIIYNSEHTAKLKQYQMNIINTINNSLKKDENGELSLDFYELSRKIKVDNDFEFKFSKYIEVLKYEKECLLGDNKRGNINTKLVIIFMIIVIFIISLSIKGISAVGTMFFLGISTFVYSAFIYRKQFINIETIIILILWACFQGFIVVLMAQNGAGALYIPYLLAFIIMQCVLKFNKKSAKEKQMVQYIAGLRRYIKDFSLLNEKDALDYIVLWEDYFIMAIALNLNDRVVNYFYNYGKEQDSNLSYSISAVDSFEEFNYHMNDSFEHVSTYSSFSGDFSGGSSSGGGRWPVVEAVVASKKLCMI